MVNLLHNRILQDNRLIYLVLLILSVLAVLPSFSTGFIGDDLLWILNARESDKIPLLTYIREYEILGYFRPLSLFVFKILWDIFGNSIWGYHIFIVLVQSICSLLVFYLFTALKYDKITSFLAAVIFTLFACHAETIYSISCLNEMLSCFFILAGLYLLVIKHDNLSALIISLLFFLALLSRESAICFIPIVLVMMFRVKNLNTTRLLIVTVTPVILYFLIRLLLSQPSAQSIINTAYIDTNILSFIYKVFHYFINILLPVKLLFTFFGEELRESLKISFLYPGIYLFRFLLLFGSLFLLFSALIFLSFKYLKLKKELLFPVLLTLSGLIVYLPFHETAERFLYFPSFGLALSVSIAFIRLHSVNRKIAIVFTVLFILVHTIALYKRADIYKSSWAEINKITENLYTEIHSVPQNSNILLSNFPLPVQSIFFLSIDNFQKIWDFYYPGNKYTFYYTKDIINNKSEFTPADTINFKGLFLYQPESLRFKHVL